MVRSVRWLVALPVLAVWAAGITGCGGPACNADLRCVDGGALLPPSGWDAASRVVQADAACAVQSIHAQRGPAKPVDVIFVIDNSGSMSEEIAQVRDNINRDFASTIAASGIDFRVIVISRYGTDQTGICIGPPLAAADCAAGLEHTNSAMFFHYSQEIGSTDALCHVLASFDRPDEKGRAPQGWQAWLRPAAAKEFVIISDDSAACAYHDGETQVVIGADGAEPFEDALTFHKALLARSPEQFGVPPDVKYSVFSIVGLAPGAVPNEALFPHQSLEQRTCDTAPSPGLSYQALSIITDALRYPVCEGRSFDAIFRVLARSVIEASKIDCVFELPQVPAGKFLELSTVNLAYRATGASAARRLTQVASPSDCKDDRSFYIRDRIELCASACRLLQEDPMPEIDILYGCALIPD